MKRLIGFVFSSNSSAAAVSPADGVASFADNLVEMAQKYADLISFASPSGAAPSTSGVAALATVASAAAKLTAADVAAFDVAAIAASHPHLSLCCSPADVLPVELPSQPTVAATAAPAPVAEWPPLSMAGGRGHGRRTRNHRRS